MDESFGVFGIIFVGNFQQLPPICDTPIYDEDASDYYLLYSYIQDVVVLQKSQRQKCDDPLKGAFIRIQSRCTETETQGDLLQEDWDVLKTQFIQNATDASNERWNNASYIFHDNKTYFKYNMMSFSI